MEKKQKPPPTRGQDKFMEQHRDEVTGVISGLDRVRLRASLPPLCAPEIMTRYLNKIGVLRKDFAAHVTSMTAKVRLAAERLSQQHGRGPVRYIHSSSLRKDDYIKELARRDSITSGLIAVLSCVEPCMSHTMRRDPEQKKLVLGMRTAKCLHYYFYYEHEDYGLMHLRLQSWYPFQINLCLNGRLWLSRQLEKENIGFERRENALLRIDDYARAQQLADQQIRHNYTTMLETLIAECHPTGAQIREPMHLRYKLSVEQSEYATDITFKTPEALARTYPRLLRHGIENFGAPEVLRFLGRKTPAHGHAHARLKAEVLSELKHRPEGARLKHQLNSNSVKMYDKHAQVLRIETTINKPEEFRAYRKTEGKPARAKRWLPMRRNVADMPRRAQVSAQINQRYLEAIGSVRNAKSAGEAARELCRAKRKGPRRYRALNPWSEQDARLLDIISQGQWLINGFKNADVREALYGKTAQRQQRKKDAARVSRQLALMRAHGLIRKIPGRNRYLPTRRMSEIVHPLLAARRANIEELTKLAA